MAISIKAHRGGQVPEPTEDGRLRLGAEIDWLVEGDDLELVEVEKALPRECQERYGLALVLRFGNAVGSFDAGPLGRISVHSGKWGERDFDRMLADITQRMSLLPFAAGSGASLPYDRSIATDQRVLYHVFIYLRHILSATAPTEDQLLPALRVVLARPHRALERVFHWTPLERVRRVDARSLLGVAASRARLTRSPRAEGIALAQALNGHLPQAMEESRAETTIDLAENQFVRAFLDQALGIVDAMRAMVLTRADGFARRLSIDCESMARELGLVRQHAMWRDVSEMRRLPGESQVLQRRRGYKDIFRHFIRLRLACRLPFHNAARMLEIKDIAELYEMWCFFEVQLRVSQALGQQPIQAQSEQVDHFGARLGWGLRVAWAGGLELFYNLSFSDSVKANADRRRSYSLRLRPDIVLRIPHGPNAGDHIFDAKFKVTRLAGAIRADEQTDERLEAEERRGVFQQADIYKMHTYRDALPSARSVWILYPGSEFRFFDVEHGGVDEASELRPIPDGVGAVALQPGVDGELGVVVGRLVAGYPYPHA
jgi:predicted component of viral defense system (DUF524 family)